jgi:hypothetical protein
MAPSQVPLKDPKFAAFLAFLLPGLGHFYQRRYFKGVLYSVCILGTFFTGMRIGHGQVVYFNWQPSENRTYAYLCQFWVGTPALPALFQSQFRAPEGFSPNYVPRHFQASFEGTLEKSGEWDGIVAGTIDLQPQQPDSPRIWSGKLTGIVTTESGTIPIEGQVTPGSLESPIKASSRRKLSGGTFEGHVAGKPDQAVSGQLDGSVPRPLWDWYEVPLQETRVNDAFGDQSELDRAHFELGSRFELGVVFTMIAGLLNILAIYDALEGPAYDGEEEGATDTGGAPSPAAA